MPLAGSLLLCGCYGGHIEVGWYLGSTRNGVTDLLGVTLNFCGMRRYSIGEGDFVRIHIGASLQSPFHGNRVLAEPFGWVGFLVVCFFLYKMRSKR